MRILEYEEYKVKKEECERLYEEIEPWFEEFPAANDLIAETPDDIRAKYQRMLELYQEVSWYEDYHGLKY